MKMDHLRQPCSPDEYIGYNSEDIHKHKCICGTVWKHSGEDCQVSGEAFDLGHTCPNCGREERLKYFSGKEERERHDLATMLALFEELKDFEANNFKSYCREYIDDGFDDLN